MLGIKLSQWRAVRIVCLLTIFSSLQQLVGALRNKLKKTEHLSAALTGIECARTFTLAFTLTPARTRTLTLTRIVTLACTLTLTLTLTLTFTLTFILARTLTLTFTLTLALSQR